LRQHEQDALHGAAHKIGADQTDSHSSTGQHPAFSEDERKHPIARRTERHSQGDFMPALRAEPPVPNIAKDTHYCQRSAVNRLSSRPCRAVS
jgi:hypothetical protein